MLSKRRIFLALAAVAALLISLPALAATLIVSGGILTGATGVNVGGTLYDVTFVDGTCASAFTGCDSNSDFAISGGVGAGNAASALLGQVFVDGPDGMFDSNPDLTFGCDPVIAPVCTALIPYNVVSTDLQVIGARNFDGSDDISDGTIPQSSDLTIATTSVWARFTLSPAAVPEPSTWAMMLLGFGAIGVAMRRRKIAGGCHA